MKTKMNISIKQRIQGSFSLLVLLFVINGIITILTINSNKKSALNIFYVFRPSIQALDDFEKKMLESKMYTTNWVFLRSNLEDKKLLNELHDSGYKTLKSTINVYCSQWLDKSWTDSLNKVYSDFEELLVIEKNIMGSLKSFKDYDDPVIKLEAERKVEEEVFPRTIALMNSLKAIHDFAANAQEGEGVKLERSSMNLRMLIIVLAITIIIAGFLLSIYMTRVIIKPVNKIRLLINDLGKGIIRKADHRANGDEIGKMVLSVNNLSEKLQATAAFAHETGLRNFDMPFTPLSDEDTLGKALIAMRNNLKTNEQELIDANAEIQTVFNASLDAVVIIDEEGKIVKWDKKSEILFGWKEDEVMGLSLSEIIIPFRYREAHQQGMKHFLKTGKGPILGKTVEVHALKKNNDEFDISLSVSPSFIKDKYRFIGFIRDITPRKKAEAELRGSEERYRQIVETAREGIWMIDENNRTDFVNKQLCEIFGYTSEEMIGKELFYFMDEEGKKIASASVEQKKLGISETMDFKFITKSGKIVWTHLSNSPFLDDKGKYMGAMSMVTDITQRKLDEELLRQSEIHLAIKNKELERKNKELEQFAYVASHDLQEPLRTTASFVGLLQKQYKGKFDEKADKYMDYIVTSSERIMTLISDLLEHSRIGNKKEQQDVDCNKVLAEVLADMGTVVNEIGMEITSMPLPVIKGYPAEIKQLFQNLLINTIKFRKKDIPSKVNITVYKKGNAWEFAISDNGLGIAKEHFEKIFVIFQRLHTRNKYNGSGIGLSHCKKIVELHEGKIWLESELGKGSTFYFTIPLKTTGDDKVI
jgi:PAS domain S-box-containing protein